ncbi:uncharacterized protein CIMG_11219 [Coccidioides immitis RS]|uniref:Uncharacterized protein n=3 Tax=Coccidioides immitis TaxID=5501 RepID=A0A0D8JXB7_COCIM|nr:uncharacterized protein CIMG_11219 [Coccidioides immitis RS]KJF61576.1 hypothetical protein CIMG_11219 [Coccidioides immitis RS]KMU79603.1 hypothetical protein CISG_02021 [Coccidioides immitis RMSCC 3703]KMU91510.1 hypothetical protein CIHG_09262 [Coccidioides immitis H538.4]
MEHQLAIKTQPYKYGCILSSTDIYIKSRLTLPPAAFPSSHKPCSVGICFELVEDLPEV